MPRAVGGSGVQLGGVGRPISFAIDGTEVLEERIAVIESRLNDASPGFQVAADVLEAHVAKTFETQGAHIGKPWRALAPSTQRARLRRTGYYQNPPTGRPAILIWTTRMRRSFRRGSIAHIRRIGQHEMLWGSRDPRARFHQRPTKPGRPPKRTIIGFRDAIQRREVIINPVHMYLRGLAVGDIRRIAFARAGV